MKSLVCNGHIISPDLEISGGAVEIDGGRISALHKPGAELPQAEKIIDAGGRYVMPGFVDIHAHGADGRDVCDNKTESIRHIARRKLGEGVTTWLPTTLTQPQQMLEEIAAKCAEYMGDQQYAKTPGLHIEGPFINKEHAGAQNPQFVREPSWQELERIHGIAPVALMSIAPELPGACDCIRQARGEGIVCSAAHSAASYAEIMRAKQAGLTHLTHFGNAMTGLHHREIGIVGAGLLDPDLKMELICDLVHLSADFLQLVFSLKPIEQLMLITDSMCGSWIGDGEVQLGGLPVIIADGQARLKEGGVLAGSVLRFNEGLRHVAALGVVPLPELVKATSWNQAQSLGLEGIGKIEPGFCADIVILNEDFSVWKTLVDGQQR